MDPQQRILLQLTWEALEDAGIRPSSIAGTEVGVFVGASQTDYAPRAQRRSSDRGCAFRHRQCARHSRQPHLLHLRPAWSEHHLRYGVLLVAGGAASGGGSLAQRSDRHGDRWRHQCHRQLRRSSSRSPKLRCCRRPVCAAHFPPMPTAMCAQRAAPSSFCARASRVHEPSAWRYSRLGRQFRRPHQRHFAALGKRRRTCSNVSIPAPGSIRIVCLSSKPTAPARRSAIRSKPSARPQSRPRARRSAADRLDQVQYRPRRGGIGACRSAQGIVGPQSRHPSAHVAHSRAQSEYRLSKVSICAVRRTAAAAAMPRNSCAGINSFGFGGTNAHVVIAPGRKPPEARSRRPGHRR